MFLVFKSGIFAQIYLIKESTFCLFKTEFKAKKTPMVIEKNKILGAILELPA